MTEGKHIIITEETLKLLNKAKAKLLNKNPSVHNLKDDATIKEALKKYLEATP